MGRRLRWIPTKIKPLHFPDETEPLHPNPPLNPQQRETPTNLVKGLLAHNNVYKLSSKLQSLLTKLVEIRLDLIRRRFLTDSADENLFCFVGLRFRLRGCVLRVDLLSIEGVRRNWKNSIHGFWGRKRDETEASAPLKEKNLLRMGNMLRGVIVHLW